MSDVKGFDLNDFDKLSSEDGVWVELTKPDGVTPLLNDKNEPVKVLVIGVDSPIYRKKRQEFMNRRLKKNKLNLGTAEQHEAEKVELLVACTRNWSGFIKGGENWPFSPENARTLYSSANLQFIAEQVDDFIGERANFL